VKIREIIEMQIRDLGVAGFEPRYILMTPRAVDVLFTELDKDGGGVAALDRSRLNSDGVLTFMNLDVILDPERSRFLPVSVVGSPRAELDLYMMKVKR
jgi:hypothetical protein